MLSDLEKILRLRRKQKGFSLNEFVKLFIFKERGWVLYEGGVFGGRAEILHVK